MFWLEKIPGAGSRRLRNRFREMIAADRASEAEEANVHVEEAYIESNGHRNDPIIQKAKRRLEVAERRNRLSIVDSGQGRGCLTRLLRLF